MAARSLGPVAVDLVRTTVGHRNYKVTSKVEVTSGGPRAALTATGLYTPGSTWAVSSTLYGIDIDPAAYCRWDATVKPFAQKEGEAIRYYLVEQVFSTEPPDTKSCVQNQIENPLLQPHRISGGSVNYQEEATHDRFGNPVVNSAFEQMRGSQVEFDKNRHTVKIEQNVAVLDFALCDSMIDTVNALPLWGAPRRCVKLSKFDWEAKYYGTCLRYFVRKFDFDSNIRTDPVTKVRYSGFDRRILDEGTKALRGKWTPTLEWELINDSEGNPPNPHNPAHFIRVTDVNANPMRVILDGAGKPYDPRLDVDARWWCLMGKRIVGAIGVALEVQYDPRSLNATCPDAYARMDELNEQLAGAGWVFTLHGPWASQAQVNTGCQAEPVLNVINAFVPVKTFAQVKAQPDRKSVV